MEFAEHDNIQFKLITMLYGGKENTASAAIYAETGRYRLCIRSRISIVKY